MYVYLSTLPMLSGLLFICLVLSCCFCLVFAFGCAVLSLSVSMCVCVVCVFFFAFLLWCGLESESKSNSGSSVLRRCPENDFSPENDLFSWKNAKVKVNVKVWVLQVIMSMRRLPVIMSMSLLTFRLHLRNTSLSSLRFRANALTQRWDT